MIQSDENENSPLPVIPTTASQREEKQCTCEACRDKRYVYSDHLQSRNYNVVNMEKYKSD
jgi:hypothetical protein